MYIQHVILQNYRNIAKADLVLTEGKTILYGDNAQGKTNVLEAIYVSAIGKSHRTQKDKEMIRWGAQTAQIQIRAQRRDGQHDIHYQILQNGQKKITVNGNELLKIGDLLGNVHVVLFSPEDLRLIKDGPAERRRFVDIELSQIKPTYLSALQQYQHILKQRNNLLKDIMTTASLEDTLSVWDEQLCLYGAVLIKERALFLNELANIAAEIHKHITDEQESLEVIYAPSVCCEKDILQDLQAALFKNKNEDLRRGMTTIGPHRDDIILRVNGVDVRAFGSQGQQRTTALSMKLSEVALLYARTGEYPILLLDDVMSELDEARQKKLIEFTPQVQTIITCAQAEKMTAYFEHIGTCRKVVGGCVI